MSETVHRAHRAAVRGRRRSSSASRITAGYLPGVIKRLPSMPTRAS